MWTSQTGISGIDTIYTQNITYVRAFALISTFSLEQGNVAAILQKLLRAACSHWETKGVKANIILRGGERHQAHRS
jgi:hypothetical protein